MATGGTETILIVDDEEPVRRTFSDWLEGSGLDCIILQAPDAEIALKLANEHTIDLAILDWALGAGDDGLQLLQDLYAFHPDIVAIMITGYANQATPLDAMRMGVRDYLDKNSDLNRDNFLKAVRRQLDTIGPAKVARRLHVGLRAFRDAVAKVLPLVQSAAALNDPVPLPDAVRALLRFLIQATGARDGVLLVRHYDADDKAPETCRVYGADGARLDVTPIPFARSIAGAAQSMQAPAAMNDLRGIDLQPFEKNRHNLLALPLGIASGIQVVIELFDKEGGTFQEEDQRLARSAGDLGTALLQQALAQKQTREMLVDSLEAALKVGDDAARNLVPAGGTDLRGATPTAVLDSLRASLSGGAVDPASSEQSVRIAELIRALAERHGPPALEHCLTLLENIRRLLDRVSGDRS